jgi:hypothetical protein
MSASSCTASSCPTATVQLSRVPLELEATMTTMHGVMTTDLVSCPSHTPIN